MRQVLYVSHTSQMGGAEHSLLTLLERLDRDRFRPAVVVPEAGPLTERLDALDVTVHTAPMERLARTRNPLRLAAMYQMWRRAAAAIAELLRHHRIDLVHANSTTAHLFASPAAARTRTPCIWHVRDVSLTRVAHIDAQMTRRADAIIAISSFIRENVPEPGREKAVVIHNGVDAARFAPGDAGALRAELGFKPETPVAGIVGQIVPWKGQDRFLQAAALVAKQQSDARFLVVGDNPFGDHPGLLDRLKLMAAEWGIADRVTFTGWREDVPEVMNALDVLVLASENEPFGRVVIEAMACSKPVVAFACGGPLDIIEAGRTGLLVPPFDVEAMADTIKRLLADPETARTMGRAGRQTAVERFSAEACADKVQEVYARLLESA
jgi:glycosyltransferase involved in cell wall biosynthesis